MHVMYGYVEIYDITAATAKAFEMITRSHQKLVKKEEANHWGLYQQKRVFFTFSLLGRESYIANHKRLNL